MKYKLIAVALTLSLSACSSQSITAKASSVEPAQQVSLEASATSLQDQQNVITLKQIMADPDWFGRAPESWYWGDDSKTIFYRQKQLGNPLRDLYQLSPDQQASKDNGQLVSLAKQHQYDDKNAQVNSAGTHEVYIFKGNVYVKDLRSQVVNQVTRTSTKASQAMFLNNGDIAYRVGNSFYQHNLLNGQVIELATLVLADKKPAVNEPETYLAKEQHKLIDYIALQHRNNQLNVQQAEALQRENDTVADSRFYLGKDKRVSHAVLSPNGTKLIISISDNKPSRAKTDIMPNYITSDGNIAAEKVRPRVADNRKYNESLYVLDLVNSSKVPLSYDTLPGFDDDVLADVKKENYARLGKKYQSKKQARNIHVLRMRQPIKWSADGTQVALMLEAWDNKTRWLTSVDFADASLTTQHKLHDDAWINWSFNEFGWLSKDGKNSLYYLSEESGYSHLYHKPLKGKARQLTSGNFEVSDITVSKHQDKFIFKANKKHPGIYEIYQVDLAKNFTALTDLGGMNNYQLSPDESKLLVEHSTLTMPPELYVKALDTNQAATRVTYTVSEQFLAMPWTAPNIVAIKSSHQEQPIYSKVYLPKNYDVTAQKNKAVMFSHGAGYLQNSHMGWSGYFREFMFHSMLVQQGYVVIDMDYRASKGYGRDWRTAIYRHMGSVEVEDMRDGVNWIIENANVDPQRIGTYGGSYGGFLTLMSMFTAPDLFASGSALRLVSDWAYYNHGYTSNILNTPEDDPIAYERSSPIYFAEGLEKPLLINAPMVDDNVFFEDSVRLVQRLIELEKQDFETAIYPVEPHGFVQPSSWLDEYRRIYKLFENTL